MRAYLLRSVISVPVEEVSEGFVVVSFRLEYTTVDSQRELLLRSRSAALSHRVTFFKEGGDVGVCVFHTINIARFALKVKTVTRLRGYGKPYLTEGTRTWS